MNLINNDLSPEQSSIKKWTHIEGLHIRNNHNNRIYEIKREYHLENAPKGVIICEGKRSNNIPYDMIEFRSQHFPTLHEMLQSAYPEIYI